MPEHDVKQSERDIYNRGYASSDILPDRELMARLLSRRDRWLDTRVAMLPGGASVLDVGCGAGRTSTKLAQMGLRVTAIDLSEVRIREAKERAQDLGLNIDFFAGDAEQLDFAPETFDAVHCAAILHHLPDVENDVVRLRNLLRPGGSFFAMEPGLLNPFAFVRRRFFPTAVHTPDERPFVPSKFFAMFRRRFRIVECRHFYILSLVAPIIEKIVGRRAASMVLGPTAAVDELLCSLPIVRELAWYLDVHAIK